jgi:hypothetical protein
MQALLDKNETRAWLKGKTEAEVAEKKHRAKAKRLRETISALAVQVERIREAVRRTTGCYREMTREDCRGCVLYEDPSKLTTVGMCSYPTRILDQKEKP